MVSNMAKSGLILDFVMFILILKGIYLFIDHCLFLT